MSNLSGQTYRKNHESSLFVIDAATKTQAVPLTTNSMGYLNTTLGGVNVSPDGQLAVSQEQTIFFDMVDGTTLNSDIWSTSTSGMTVTQGSGLITLNAGAANTANAYAILQSIKTPQLISGTTVIVGFSIQVNTAVEPNATIEFGFGTVATNSAPTDGVFFRIGPTGTFAVSNYGGVETVQPLATITPGTLHDYVLLISQLSVIFLENTTGAQAGVPIAFFPTLPTQQAPTLGSRQSVFARTYNGAGSPTTPPQVIISSVGLNRIDTVTNKSWTDTMTGMGRGAYQGATTYTQTANHTNSTDPVAATLSNTTAGYATLGGRFSFAAVGGTTTDYALFAYQVPAGFQLYITSIVISSANTGAVDAVTSTVLDWSVGINSSAVSLATTDTATTWAPRRIPLGLQSFPVGAAIGSVANDIIREFPTSLVVDGGRYIHIILEVPIGTATASEVIRGDVFINGYIE